MNDTVRFVQVEPTTRCNFRCGFCAGRRMDQTDLPLEAFERLIEALPDLEYLEIQGEGEPLLHPDFFRMVAIAHARGIHTSTITNGSLLSDAKVEAILDSGLDSLRVSTETHDDARFVQIRGGSLRRVRAGVERLLAGRAARGLTRPSVGLAVTVLASTLDDLPGIFALYLELGLDGGLALQPLNRMPAYSAGYSSEMEGERLERALHEGRYLGHITSAAYQAIVEGARSKPRHFYDLLFEDSHGGCPWLDKGLAMDRRGRLTPCCMVKDEAQAFGRLGEIDLEEALRRRGAMAVALAAGEAPAPCEGCSIARSALMAAAAAAQEASARR